MHDLLISSETNQKEFIIWKDITNDLCVETGSDNTVSILWDVKQWIYDVRSADQNTADALFVDVTGVNESPFS